MVYRLVTGDVDGINKEPVEIACKNVVATICLLVE